MDGDSVMYRPLCFVGRSGPDGRQLVVEKKPIELLLSAEDDRAFRAQSHGSKRWLRVTNLLSGAPMEVRHAACGLGCRCDIEAQMPQTPS